MNKNNSFDNIVLEISKKINLIDIVSEVVRLKKSGSNFVGLCPFHKEKTPSFSVSPDKGLFYCFGCGVGGNVFTFLMKTRGITFKEALEFLAKRAGVRLPERRSSQGYKRERELKERIFNINRLGAEFFQIMLRREEGKGALLYLTETRGLSDETINEFRLGYAPHKWNALVNFLTEKGISTENGQLAGLIMKGKEGNYYDIFRDRIIFPITDMDGNIIGFGGRIISKGEPKYLNSPETPVFVKGSTFYGMELTWKDVRRVEEVFIVEGYFDLIMMWQAGIKNVLAPLGTALTEEHILRLRGIVKKAYLLFDSDEAGMRAAERVLPLFIDSGIDAFVIKMPTGDDPDTFVRREGAEGLIALKSDAIPIWGFYLESLSGRVENLPWRKASVIDDIILMLRRVSHPVVRNVYLKQVAEKFGVTESTLSAMLKRSLVERGEQERPADEAKNFNKKDMALIYAMLKYPEGIEKLKDYINAIENDKLKRIANYIRDAYIKMNRCGVDELLENLEEEEIRNLIIKILFECEDTMESSQAIDRIIHDFELRKIREEERRLSAELSRLQKIGAEAEIKRLLYLKSELIKRKQELKR